MGAREGTIVGSSLLAMCVLASAVPYALEPVQPGLTISRASAQTLPKFLDDNHLPAFQEAWPDGRPAEPVQPGSTLQSALPVLAPSADSASGVRQRAEELSRRFGASTAVVPDAVPETVPSRTADNEDMPPRKSAMNTTETAALPQSPADVATTDGDFAHQKLRLAAPPPPPDKVPPLPRRAPETRTAIAVPKTRPVSREPARAEVTRPARSARTYSAAATAHFNPAAPPPDPKAALRGTIMTNELSSFGWNSQPK